MSNYAHHRVIPCLPSLVYLPIFPSSGNPLFAISCLSSHLSIIGQSLFCHLLSILPSVHHRAIPCLTSLVYLPICSSSGNTLFAISCLSFHLSIIGQSLVCHLLSIFSICPSSGHPLFAISCLSSYLSVIGQTLV